MRIPGTSPTGRLSATAPSRSNGSSVASSLGGNVRAIQDVQSVLGIPANEFTPRVRDAIMSLMGEVERLRQDLNNERRRLSQLAAEADMDVLVPCLNRRAFVREMSRILSFVERYDLPASLIYVDLDNFKDINDQGGHAAGDAALLHVCELIKAHIRESDLLGRLGGDEFGLILAKANQAEAQTKADLLAQLIKASPLVFNGRAILMSFTTGAYEFKAGENPAETMARADRAMYERKQKRRATG